MTYFVPEFRITIAGQILTNETVTNLTITSGRTDIYLQPNAGYVQVELMNLDSESKQININDGITIQVKDSAGVWTSIFGGYITDLNAVVKNIEASVYTTSYQLTALGALAKLNRTTTLGVLTSQLEGLQIKSLLQDLLTNQWNEVPASETWATYNASETWANAQNLGLGTIDNGQYEMVARTSSITYLYNLVSFLATSGFGYLWEDSNGLINYADTLHRTTYLGANGYVVISGNNASLRNLKSSMLTGDVRNKITVKYGNNLASSSTATDATSILTYGQIEASVDTAIKNSVDADAQANRYLSLRAYPREKMPSISFELTNPDLSDSLRDHLLKVFMGMPIKITDLPLAISSTEFSGFVEGWTWSISANRMNLNINLSPTEFSIVALQWGQVTPTEAWNTISGTMTWNNALGAIS